MTSSQAVTAAAITGGLRSAITKMRDRDGLSTNEIAEVLGISPELVEQAVPGSVAPPAPNEEDVLTRRAVEIENALDPYKQIAIDAMAELVTAADSDSIRFAASREILRAVTGDYRQKKSESGGGISAQQFNVFIQQAAQRHTEAMKEVKPIEVTTIKQEE